MATTFDITRYQDKATIQRVIHSAEIIAIVGLSSNVLRASYFVGAYLQSHGYRIIPVNPTVEDSAPARAKFVCVKEVNQPETGSPSWMRKAVLAVIVALVGSSAVLRI